MSMQDLPTSGSSSNDGDEAIISGWEGAMAEVFENQYSERAERVIFADEESADGEDQPAETGDAAIIQSATIDSSPLIQLESLRSSSSDGKEEKEDKDDDQGAGDASNNAWLHLAGSSSSKGSLAPSFVDHVVPAISGSGSALDPIDVAELETAQTEMFSPRGGLSAVPTDELRTPINGAHAVAMQTAETNLVAETGELLGPILSAASDYHSVMQPEEAEVHVVDLLGPNPSLSGRMVNQHDTQWEPSQHSATSGQNAEVVGRIVDSLADHQRLQTRPDRTQPPRVFIGPDGGSSVSQSSTFESRLTNQPSSWSESRTRNPLSPSTNATSYSVGRSLSGDPTNATSFSGSRTLSVDATTYTRDDTLSPKTDAFSPTSLYDSVLSEETYVSGTTTNFESTFSNDRSASVMTEYTSYTDRNSYTETETDATFTGHSRRTGLVSPGGQSTNTGFCSTTGHTRGSDGEGTTSQHSRGSKPDTTGAAPPYAHGSAQPLAAGNCQRQTSQQHEKQKSNFAQSLMAKTRSRADTGAVISSRSDSFTNDSVKQSMVRVGEELDERFIVNTALARKRVSVVQLLAVGLVSLLVCFFGSIYIQSSCHYVSGDVAVGEEEQVYNLHYGLWKYSPVGSAFQGYTYCDGYEYDDAYTAKNPFLSRYSSLAASLGSGFAVFVLWTYLIFGQGTRFLWNAAVKAALLAGVFHGASVFFILSSPMCVEKNCKLGPAGILALVACGVNMVLAFEMYYNSPIKSWMDDVPSCPSEEQPGAVIGTLEITDLEKGASAYCRRLITTPSAEIPTLNQIQRKNEDAMGFGREPAQGVVYSPPAIV